MFPTAASLYRSWILVTSLTQCFTLASPIRRDEESLASHDATGGGFQNGLWLRIMPLGASITYGVLSNDGNGYRDFLATQLINNGNPVNMVGSRRNGTMEDNDNEGWPGDIISEVHDKAISATPKYKPNIVLINVGTNDCSGNVSISTAGKRISSLIDDVYKGSSRTTVILSTLLVRSEKKYQDCVLDVNSQFKTVAATQKANGRRLVLVDMQPPAGPTTAELVDGIHPTSAGYNKMATIWFKGIQAASTAGFLQEKENIPGNADGVPDRGVYG
ncbi:carbohydrate esterase family 3 protein [Nemania sp. NC0429]|nr:carbohydrate esterase family 3 protein [Nemania sp. NC0429]